MEMTLSSRNFFFPLYDYHQTAEISFMWRAVLRRQIDAFKNCVTREVGGGGVELRTMRYTGYPFQASGIV